MSNQTPRDNTGYYPKTYGKRICTGVQCNVPLRSKNELIQRFWTHENPSKDILFRGFLCYAGLLCSDLDFRAVLENKCDLTILVDDGFFYHHRPDGAVPVVHHLRLFLEGADIKRHFLVLLTAGSA